jgi:hypothetical protein
MMDPTHSHFTTSMVKTGWINHPNDETGGGWVISYLELLMAKNGHPKVDAWWALGPLSPRSSS